MEKARYLRLADTVSKAIQSGALRPGHKLPTHRAFAEQFNVALATATRTYRELERRGLVVGEAGRGMFVRDLGVPMTLGMQQTDDDGLVDLVFNMPGNAADTDILRQGLRRMAKAGDLDAILRYQPHGGRPHERQIIAEHLKARLGPVNSRALLVTSGAQHGLAIIGFGLLQRGDVVAIDALTYPGFKSVAALQGIDLLPISNKNGVTDPDDLARKCRTQNISAVYLMPTVHNPLGTVMDEATRNRFVEVARQHDLLLIEDSAYAFLDTNPPTSLFVLAPERTVYVGGFSKSLATGLRLGYVIAPLHHIDRLLEAIRATTWNAPALISGLVTGWIEDGTLDAFEQDRRRDGQERQKVCQAVLGPLNISAHPSAGFAWLPLEKGLRSEKAIACLKDKGISVSGAEPFATTTAVPQALRLAFGGVPKNDLAKVLVCVRESIETLHRI